MENYKVKFKINNFLVFGVFLFALFSFAQAASAATYYVATTGNDVNTCSQAQNITTPKRTITAALACVGAAGTEAGAGYTVEVASGIYNEQLINKIPSGSSEGARFTLKSATPKGATFRYSGDQSNYGTIAFTIDSHYITIDGFVIDGSAGTNSSGITFSSYNSAAFQHISIHNNEIRNMATDGMTVNKGSFEILNNSIHDIGTPCKGLGPGFCHGIYASGYTVNSLFEGNTIYNSAGYGLHFYDNSNTMHDNIIRNNILHHAGPEGAGIIIGGQRNLVYNNIAYGSGGNGIRLAYSSNANNKVYNNTVYNNGFGSVYGCDAAGICDVDGVGNIFRNNIVLGNNAGQIMFYGGSGQISDHNLVSGSPIDVWVSPSVNNFHLQPTSPAINAGVTLSEVTTDFDGILRPQGSAYDIGAYEYVSSGTSTPPPTSGSADLNADSRVNSVDAAILMGAWGSTARPLADINKDGIVNSVDASLMMGQWSP